MVTLPAVQLGCLTNCSHLPHPGVVPRCQRHFFLSLFRNRQRGPDDTDCLCQVQKALSPPLHQKSGRRDWAVGLNYCLERSPCSPGPPHRVSPGSACFLLPADGGVLAGDGSLGSSGAGPAGTAARTWDGAVAVSHRDGGGGGAGVGLRSSSSPPRLTRGLRPISISLTFHSSVSMCSGLSCSLFITVT